jgi:hypothetical protein
MRIKWAAALMAVGAALAGCSTQTNVSLATSVPSSYQHVFLTVQEVWFSTSATASAEDSGWNRFPLSTPFTVDLVSLTAGKLQQIASSLKVPAGTYSQMRLIPVDAAAPLAASATAAGAKFNAEVDYTDPSGHPQQAPLELLNPDKGIGIATALTIKASLSQLGALTTTTTSNCATGQTNCTPSSNCLAGQTGCTSTPVATTPTTQTGTSTSSTASLSLAVTVDGIHDLVRFAYGAGNQQQIGVLLNPHPAAYDLSSTGAIKGSIDTSNVSGSVNSSGQIAVQVTAETLSVDGTRHAAIQTVQVASDGSFVLYPLPVSSSSTTSTTAATGTPTSYDLVIHGPQIATVIIKSIPVAAGDPSSAAAVSVGTVSLSPATSYSFNMEAGTVALPAGALVDLYQTIPAAGEVPYLVDQVAIDPYSRALLYDESVPSGAIEWGTYVSGGNVALSTATPTQGASTYLLSAQAPLFAAGQLLAVLGPPASGSGPVPVAMPTLVPAGGSGSVSIRVAPVTPGKYDRGELIFSHDGQVVQTVAIDTALTQNGGATLQVSGIPIGGAASSFDNSVYYVSTRAWLSSDPAGTLQRQSFTTPIDLSSGSATVPAVNVD